MSTNLYAFNLDFKGSDERRSVISLDYVEVKEYLNPTGFASIINIETKYLKLYNSHFENIQCKTHFNQLSMRLTDSHY